MVFFGVTRFTVTGLNLSKLATRLTKEGFRLFRIKSGKKSLDFSIKTANYKKLIAILEELNYNYIIKTQTGARASLRMLSAYAGALLGAVAVIVYIAVSASFLHSIEVGLPSRETEVLKLLSERGVTRGVAVSEIDIDGLEDALLALDGVSFVAIRLRGNKLYIDLKNSLDAPYHENLRGTEPVKAVKKAVVSRVIVYDGTALVKVGDIVEEGDEVIAPYELLNEEQVPGYASGTVYGKTYYSAEATYGGTVITKSYGGVKTYSAPVIFGIAAKLPGSPFKHFEAVYKTSITGFLIPFTTRTVTYREIIYQERECTFAEAEESLKTGLLAAARGKMPLGATFIYEWCNIETTESGIKITAVVECEEIIGGV